MLRNRSALPVLQKAYDESYLTCSTAVYYESQGDEDEAMRCWRTALDRIVEYKASKALQDWPPQSETEKALVESLRQLELQCKERIDLLAALRLSRQEGQPLRAGRLSASRDTGAQGKGWIGDGTVPAITYPELSRPSLPPRPTLAPRSSSERAVVGPGKSFSPDPADPSTASQPSPHLPGPSGQHASRSPSPEKHTMRTTLRSNRPGPKPGRLLRRPVLGAAEGPGASKAASLAWSTLGLTERTSRHSAEVPRTTPAHASPALPEENGLKRMSPFSLPRWDSHSRRLVAAREERPESPARLRESLDWLDTAPSPSAFTTSRSPNLSVSAASSALQSRPASAFRDLQGKPRQSTSHSSDRASRSRGDGSRDRRPQDSTPEARNSGERGRELPVRAKPPRDKLPRSAVHPVSQTRGVAAEGLLKTPLVSGPSLRRTDSTSSTEGRVSSSAVPGQRRRSARPKRKALATEPRAQPELGSSEEEGVQADDWKKKKIALLKALPAGVDKDAAKQILNEVVVRGDEVHWDDVAGLEIAKGALRETVVYPFLRPDLFMGLREPARGMLLFGPPGTGKTMLARAVATESKSTFFSISASSLTSKYLGESEKLVRALFALAKALAPSIIFVDEIDSLLSQRSGSGEHEATRRIKTEFLIQWSDLQRAAAGRESGEKEGGDANRVLVLAATNLPWAIDEAARRRFVRRQYIPLPEATTRASQLRRLLSQQKHNLTDADIDKLVELTAGFSGSDITALAKDAAMGPLRSLGEALLLMTKDEIRPIELSDFIASLATIRPSVSQAGLKEYEDWAREFGERGG